jgi:hypothetical protein
LGREEKSRPKIRLFGNSYSSLLHPYFFMTASLLEKRETSEGRSATVLANKEILVDKVTGANSYSFAI